MVDYINFSQFFDARETALDFQVRQDPEIPEVIAACEKMEPNRKDPLTIILHPRKVGKAMPRKVHPYPSRYHNHLDESIVTTEWTKQEEQTLLQMHELVGNKWSQISLALPGRYKMKDKGLTIV